MRRMFKLISLLGLLFFYYNIGAAGIYLLSSIPNPQGEDSIPAILYRVDQGDLVEEFEVMPAEIGVQNVKYLPDLGFIILEAKSWKTSGFCTFSIIDTKKPSFKIIKHPQYAAHLKEGVLKIPDDGVYELIKYHALNADSERYQKLLGINIVTEATREFDPEDLKFLVANGNPGGAVLSQFRVSLHVEDGKLYNPLGSLISGYIGIELPDETYNSINGSIHLLINNDDLCVVTKGWSKDLQLKGKTEREFLIFDKKNSEWKTIKVPGLHSNIRQFGNWLVGEVVIAKKDENPDFSTFQHPTKDAPSFEYRMWDQGIDYPGKVFLYNWVDGTYIEKDFGIPDSEILYVDDDKVYIRQEDALYVSTIHDHNLKGMKKIIQDNELRDIHWMFISDLTQ